MDDQPKPKPKSKPRGFAAMDPARHRAIARLGGHAVPPFKRSFSTNPQLAASAGSKGGAASRNKDKPS